MGEGGGLIVAASMASPMPAPQVHPGHPVVVRAQDGSVPAVITDGRRGTLARDHRSIVAADRETTMT
jgi:hypothetical protein